MFDRNERFTAGRENQRRFRVGCGAVYINMIFAALLLYGILAARESWQLQTRGVTTPGIVVRVAEHCFGIGDKLLHSCRYAPVVNFKVNGQNYTFKDLSSYPSAYQAGERLQVRYDPANPKTARIDNYQPWTIPINIIPLTLCIGLFFNALLLWDWRRQRTIPV